MASSLTGQPDVHPIDEPVEQDGVRLRKWERKIRKDGAAIVEIEDKTESEKPQKRGRGRPRKNPDQKAAKPVKPAKAAKKATKPPKNAIKKVVKAPEPEPEPEEELEEETEDSEDEEDLDSDEQAETLLDLVDSVTNGVSLVPGLSDAPPQRQSVPTLGGDFRILDEEEAPDLSDGKPKTLEDLVAKFPIGDGQHFIRVNRRKPQSWHGYTCHGLQRPLRDPMSYEEFVEEYGGGEYALTVMGPPRKGGIYDPSTGKLRPKTLTGEIVFTVPWDSAGYGGYAPNPESALVDVETEEEIDMRFSGANAARGPATPATAAMFKTQVEADERREERLERRERERSAADIAAVSPAIESLREMGKSAIDVAQAQADQTRREAQESIRRAQERHEKLEEQLRDAQREAREREERLREEMAGNNKLDFGGLASLMASMRPKEDNTAVLTALESARADVQRVQDASQREMDRVLRAHTDERRLWDDRVKDERERADRRLREIEELADKRVAEAERRAERMIKEVREDSDRQLRATETMYKIQLDNAAQNRDRDHQTTTTAFDSRLLAEKAALEARISMLEMENKRQTNDAEKWRQEAENNKDIVKKIQEFTGVAEALGFQKDAGGSGGDDDDDEEKPFNWKAILGQALMQGVTTLPSIISNAGEAAARLKGAQASQNQMMALAPPSMSPASLASMPTMRAIPGGDLPFGTEDGGPIGMPFDHSMAVPLPPPPQVPRVSRPVQHVQQMAPAPIQQTQAIVPVREQAPVQRQAPAAPAAPQPSRTSKRHQKSQRASEQVQETSGDDMIGDEQILMFRGALEMSIANGETPEQVAEGLKKEYGPMVVSVVAGSLSPARVAKAVMSAPDGASSVLVQPEGQAWLTKLQSLLS